MKKGAGFLVFAMFLGSVANADFDGLIDQFPHAREMGFQNSRELRDYFEIDEVTVTENAVAFSPEELAMTGITISNGTGINAQSTPPSTPSIGGTIGSIVAGLGVDLGDVTKWITLGQKIWEIVKANQPVVNVKTQTVSVLPASRPDWQMMETWQGPQAKSYTVSAKNRYGSVVVSHTYTVAFYYGGSYQGHGQFLANATIIPTDVTVAWGFTLNSDVKVGDPLNTGTLLNPVPGIGLGLDWSMSSFLKKIQGRDQFYVRGDGTSTHVNEL